MLTLRAPAKINWFLLVLGKREDGYHNIQTLLHCVSLYDTLTFERSADIEVVTAADIKAGDNLVYKAATAIKKATGAAGGARITLEKKVPISAGLGGGSSDAAAALTGLDRLWGTGLGPGGLLPIASSLGSDVPFFLGGPSAVVEGRGERVLPLGLKTRHALLIAKPALGVSSGVAYSLVSGFSPGTDTVRFASALEARDYGTVSEMARNDLEPGVLSSHPEIRALKGLMEERGAVFSLMSGSGSAVFGLFEDTALAEEAARGLPCSWASVVETL